MGGATKGEETRSIMSTCKHCGEVLHPDVIHVPSSVPAYMGTLLYACTPIRVTAAVKALVRLPAEGARGTPPPDTHPKNTHTHDLVRTYRPGMGGHIAGSRWFQCRTCDAWVEDVEETPRKASGEPVERETPRERAWSPTEHPKRAYRGE